MGVWQFWCELPQGASEGGVEGWLVWRAVSWRLERAASLDRPVVSRIGWVGRLVVADGVAMVDTSLGSLHGQKLGNFRAES